MEKHLLTVSTSMTGPNRHEFRGICSCGRFDKVASHLRYLDAAWADHYTIVLENRVEELEAVLRNGIQAVQHIQAPPYL